jgi:hypothetical protein
MTDTVTTATGLVYKPWALNGAVGYELVHPSGAVQYIYFNPSLDSDDGVDNVVVYCGSAGDPAEDEAVTHFDIEVI